MFQLFAPPHLLAPMSTLGFDPIGKGGAAFATYIRDEMAKYEKII